MHEVGSILIEATLAVLESEGGSIATLADGLGLAIDETGRPSSRVSWDALTTLIDRTIAWGGEQSIQTAATRLVASSAALTSIGRALGSPERTFAFIVRSYVPLLATPCVTTYARPRAGLHRITLEIRPGYRASRGFVLGAFAAFRGSFFAWFGVEPTTARALECTDRWGVFEFECPRQREKRGRRGADAARQEPFDPFTDVLEAHRDALTRETEALAHTLAELRTQRALRDAISERLLACDDFAALRRTLADDLATHLRIELRAVDEPLRSLENATRAPSYAPGPAHDAGGEAHALPLTLGPRPVATLTIEPAPGVRLRAQDFSLIDALRPALAYAVHRAQTQSSGGRIEAQTAVEPKPTDERLERALHHAATRWALTQAQQRVLRLLANGESNRAIADALGCTVGNVEYHVTRILRSARVASRSALTSTLWALRPPAAAEQSSRDWGSPE